MTAAGRQAIRQRFDAPLAELIAEARPCAIRTRTAGLLLAQGLIPLTKTLPRRLSLLHVRASAARGQARLPLTRRGTRRCTRRRGLQVAPKRYLRWVTSPSCDTRPAQEALKTLGHETTISYLNRDVRACAARDRIAATCQSRRDDAQGDRRPARGDGQPGHHAGIRQRASLQAGRRSLRLSGQNIPKSGWRHLRMDGELKVPFTTGILIALARHATSGRRAGGDSGSAHRPWSYSGSHRPELPRPIPTPSSRISEEPVSTTPASGPSRRRV